MHTQISKSLYSFSNFQSLLVIDHFLLLSKARVVAVIVIVCVLLSKIALQGYKDKLNALAILCDFADPFRFDVLEGIFGIDLVICQLLLLFESLMYGS